MPALAIWFIGLLASAFFAPDILRKYQVYGSAPAPSDADVTALLKTMYQSASTHTPVPGSTPGAVPITDKEPTTKEIVANAVDKPINWLFLALLAFALVFLVAQVRAGMHEAGAAVGDTYSEAKRVTNTLANADGTTGNISRRLKK